MAWHLVECANPLLGAAHCEQGRLLLAAGSDPDGHCLVDDACPRCAVLNAPQPALPLQANSPVTTTESPEATPPVSSNQ